MQDNKTLVNISTSLWDVSKIDFPEGENYLCDLESIIFSNTFDIVEVNPFFFINEACQMLANSIFLFQQGYFDCAFFSVRQSIETTISGLFLFSHPEKLKQWNSLKPGFHLNKMLKSLKKCMSSFSEIWELYEDFFKDLKQKKRKINKYVHKQGIISFYNACIDNKKQNQHIKKDYKEVLEATITAISIYRLAINPFPLLLLDEDIVSRLQYDIGYSYNSSFINKYIPKKYIDRYKQTSMYKSYYADFMQKPVLNIAAQNLAREHLFDRKDYGQIMSHKNDLSFFDISAVEFFMISEKIDHIQIDLLQDYYCCPCITNYNNIYDKSFYDKIFNNSVDWNISYKGYYISRCLFTDEYVILFHSEPLNDNEIRKIKDYCAPYHEEILKLYRDFKNLKEMLEE